MYRGEITNWRDIRGRNAAPRTLVSAGVSAAFTAMLSLHLGTSVETVADDATAVRAVAADPAAVAVISARSVNFSVRALNVSRGSSAPSPPGALAVHAQRYPLMRAIVLGADPSRPATHAMQGFADLATGAAGQAMLARAGYFGR